MQNSKNPKWIQFFVDAATVYFDSLTKQEQFLFINEYKDIDEIPLSKIFDNTKVSRSGYYNWRDNYKGKIKRKWDPDLDPIVKEAFFENKQLYGRARLAIYIENKIGWKLNEKTVGKSLQRQGLKAVPRRKKKLAEVKYTKYSSTDLIKRNFIAPEPGLKWFTDVSQINLVDGRVYLSAILDGFNREIIDFKLSRDRGFDFVYLNIEDALIKTKTKPIIHSDHGIEYTTKFYHHLIDKYGFRQSMGRPGKSTDNQPIEYFFGVLKTECIRLIPENERTIERIEVEVARYIDYYNNIRIMTKYRSSPFKYRRDYENKKGIVSSY